MAFIERIIQVAPNMKPGDIVLDFFAGSATTAHAVMKWNAEHDSQYKFIMIQLPAELDVSISSQKVTHDYLINIGRNGTLTCWTGTDYSRRNVIKENPDITADLGFKHYTLKTIDEPTLDKLVKFDNSGFVTDRTVFDLLAQTRF